MTSDPRLESLKAKASKHTKFHAQTKASAIKALVKEGLYKQDGSLSRNYGGESAKPAKTRA